jgi:curved DNA-binding protein CbpA
MFIDYYAILEIHETASQEEIKAAFRKQAVKWHPDRNQGQDTTILMQRINEAYLILKDSEARQKFNAEYQRFKAYQEVQKRAAQENTYNKQQQEYQKQTYTQKKYESTQQERNTEYANYTFYDETLKNWMDNARRQSVHLAQQTIKDFKGMVAVGFKEGVKASGNALLTQIVISVVILFIISVTKACNS